MSLKMFSSGLCPGQWNSSVDLPFALTNPFSTRCDRDGQLLEELLCAITARKWLPKWDHFSILLPTPQLLHLGIRMEGSSWLIKAFKKWWPFYTLFPSCRSDVEDHRFLQAEGTGSLNHCVKTRHPDKECLLEAITVISEEQTCTEFEALESWSVTTV